MAARQKPGNQYQYKYTKHKTSLDINMRADKRSLVFLMLPLIIALGACSTNPATGEQQFTALMPAEQEASIGAQEHAKVEKVFGKFIQGPLQLYVNDVGQRVAKNTERSDVQYSFHVIDSSIVNAFALPGGYIYVSRGLLGLANNEAELAAVLGHEIAHVTARHSAERVSQGFLAQLGATILSAAVDAPGIGRATGLGSELYIKSYSRGQEHQADELGIRYLHRAGYDNFAMASFLTSMARSSTLEAKAVGKNRQQANWFSTHPQTESRVAEASAEAATYSSNAKVLNKDPYFKMINGMVYGDSKSQGFIRGRKFYHPEIGFMFEYPSGFKLKNSPTQVVGTHSSGAVILFDAGGDKNKRDPYNYLTQVWLKGEKANNPEAITINGMRAATASFPGTVSGKRVTIQLVAIEWKPGEFFRFQVAIPNNTDQGSLDALKKATYSFRKMTSSEKQKILPDRIKIVTAKAGDSVSSLAKKMPFEKYKEEYFRVLNGLSSGQSVKAGQKYKIVVR